MEQVAVTSPRVDIKLLCPLLANTMPIAGRPGLNVPQYFIGRVVFSHNLLTFKPVSTVNPHQGAHTITVIPPQGGVTEGQFRVLSKSTQTVL